MSRSSRGRTEVFNRAQGRHRLDFARKCHETAELVGSDRDDNAQKRAERASAALIEKARGLLA